jgi:glycosyltransferase involved in cell wall biosynthesis
LILKNNSNSLTTLVLLAALNEEEGIGRTLIELKQYLNNLRQPHFLVVDGHSKDKTADVARSLGADVVIQKGKGKGNAINCALNYLNHDEIDYVILTDADYTYPAEYIPKMLEILEENPEVGMVCGNRFNSHLPCSSGGRMFYLGNKMLAFAHNIMNGIQLNDPLTGLRVIRWSALKDWTPKSNGFDIEVELNHHIERQRYHIKEIDIPYRERMGNKKLKLRHGFVILKRIIRESLN